MSHRCTKKITSMSFSRQATAPQKSKKKKKKHLWRLSIKTGQYDKKKETFHKYYGK